MPGFFVLSNRSFFVVEGRGVQTISGTIYFFIGIVTNIIICLNSKMSYT